MIKHKYAQLRLGNWVQIPSPVYDAGDGDRSNGYCRVTKLEKHELWTDALEETSYDKIAYIPLSPEILSLAGFENYTTGNVVTCWRAYGPEGGGDIQIEFCDGEVGIKIDTAEAYLTTQEIEYVHQLQNLFEDLNIEIEINLDDIE